MSAHFQKPGGLSISILFCPIANVDRAIENGANALAEGFLFGVAALLILGETWRSSRSQSKRRDSVDDHLEELSTKLQELSTRVEGIAGQYDDRWQEERLRFALVPISFVYYFDLRLGMTSWHVYWKEWWKLGYEEDGLNSRIRHYNYLASNLHHIGHHPQIIQSLMIRTTQTQIIQLPPHKAILYVLIYIRPMVWYKCIRDVLHKI